MSDSPRRPAMSPAELRRVIRHLPSDTPVDDPAKWYTTQQQHWLGWLREYSGPGAYGRKVGVNRDARYAYNHILEWKMLLYLASALRFNPDEVERVRRAAERARSKQGGAAAVRQVFPWERMEPRLRRVLEKPRKA